MFVPTFAIVGLLPMFALLIARGPVDGAGDLSTGYWGTKSATVNWCEPDYQVTHYVAEWWNTVSSLAIAVNGIYGIYRHSHTVERRYTIAFSAFVVVGTGSAAFHGTLWRSMQLMDELPMVWANTVFIYILRSLEDRPGETRRMEIIVMVILTAAASAAIINLDEAAGGQDLFLVTYASGVIFLIFQSRRLDLKYNSTRTLILLETSCAFYLGGLFVWLIDRNFCSSVRSLHLHSFWHIGADLGTYTSTLFWIWLRNERLARKQQVVGSTVATRWIQIEPEKMV